MNRLHLFRFLATVIVASLLAVPALGVYAASDRVIHNTRYEHFEATVANGDVVDGQVVDWACDYPVRVIWDGTIKESTYFDKDGNWVKTIWTFRNYSITFVNDENGKSIGTKVTNTFFITPGPEEGTWVIAYNGIGGRFVVPGEGVIKDVNDVGRLVQFVVGDYEYWETVFASAQFNQEGEPNDDPWPTVCRLLAS